jgi:hypothetical protein
MEVLRTESNEQVIPVTCSLITKVCDARHTLESVLFLLSKENPELGCQFKENVCDLIQDMHTAFLEAD